MRKRRLLWQLYPSYLLITLASLAVVAFYASWALRQFYIERTGEDLKSRAWLAEAQFRPLLAAKEIDRDRIDKLCKELGEKAKTRLTVILPDGKVVGDSEESPQNMENHKDPERKEIMKALAGDVGNSLRFSDTIKETLCYVAVPCRQDGKIVGVVRAAVPLTAIDQAVSQIRLHIALWSLLVAALLTAVGLLHSRRIARPLEQLKQGAERFARGDLTHRLPVADSLEIGALAEMLNHMAAELDDKLRAVVRQRNEREAILSSMVEGVLAIDAEDRVIRINQAAARLINTDPARAEGRTLPEIIRSTELYRLVDAVMASQKPAESEIVLRGTDERVLHVHATVLQDGREGRRGVLLVLHDVTELKRLEKVRRDFVANASHELRTPVTAIKGFVETLLDGAMHDPKELQRFLEIVDQQTDRLNALFEDLLMLSRIEQEAERAEIALSPGPIRPVLDAAVEACRFKAAEKNIRMEVTCPEDLQAAINPPLLEQAVINLIDNAVKYSPADEAVLVDAVRGESEVVIRVLDHGCGIGREHLPRIFERFYRVDPARSRKLGGTGLGLAIVKHIAQSHHGRATVESVVGQGSTFSIHLPLGNQSASPSGSASTSGPPLPPGEGWGEGVSFVRGVYAPFRRSRYSARR